MAVDTVTERIISILRGYCDNYHAGNVKEASRALGLDPETGILYKWLKFKNLPRIDKVGPCLEKIGVDVIAPWEINNCRADDVTGIQRELAETRNRLQEERNRVIALQGEVRALERTLQRLLSSNSSTLADGKVMFQQTYNSKD